MSGSRLAARSLHAVSISAASRRLMRAKVRLGNRNSIRTMFFTKLPQLPYNFMILSACLAHAESVPRGGFALTWHLGGESRTRREREGYPTTSSSGER